MVAEFSLTSPAGKTIGVKLVDLAAYASCSRGHRRPPGHLGRGAHNPQKTRVLDPTHLYLALSPDADDP